jgi:hypothetical protein
MFHSLRALSQSSKPTPSAAWTDYTPTGPWSDGQKVTRNTDGVGFTYNASLNTLTVNPNLSASVKDANSFIIQNLPAPTNGGDATNKTYVDGKAGTGGIPEAPTDGQQYGRQSSAWSVVVPNPSPSSTIPAMDGIGAAGSGATWARNDHVHPSDTTRAPVASPNFTGTPTAPTPATADNSTTISTTAYVKAQGYLTGNQTVTLTGDITGAGTSAIATTLATVNSNVGTFQGLTVNGKGLVTAAVNQNYLIANQTITISGDISGSGATAITATLPNVNATIGTFQGITVNAKGLVTNAVNQNYAPASSVPGPSTTIPVMNGTGAAGSAATYSRGDHVHPTDTSVLPLSGGTLTGPLILAANPTVANGAATKGYVDSAASGAGGFPSGTVMLFYQAAAPVGWTQVTTQNDKALRVVSGTGGVSGGTNPFSTVMAQTVVGNHTLSTAETANAVPVSVSNTITVYPRGSSGLAWPYTSNGNWYPVPVAQTAGGYLVPYTTDAGTSIGGGNNSSGSNTMTGYTQGGGGAHNHPITMSIQYCDMILASKN